MKPAIHWRPGSNTCFYQIISNSKFDEIHPILEHISLCTSTFFSLTPIYDIFNQAELCYEFTRKHNYFNYNRLDLSLKFVLNINRLPVFMGLFKTIAWLGYNN